MKFGPLTDEEFRQEVKQALHEADDPSAVWISNEEVQRKAKIRRDEWRRRAISKEAPADSAE